MKMRARKRRMAPRLLAAASNHTRWICFIHPSMLPDLIRGTVWKPTAVGPSSILRTPAPP